MLKKKLIFCFLITSKIFAYQTYTTEIDTLHIANYPNRYYLQGSLGVFSGSIRTQSSRQEKWDDFFYGGDSRLPLSVLSDFGAILNSKWRVGLKFSIFSLFHKSRSSLTSQINLSPSITYLTGNDIYKIFLSSSIGFSRLNGYIDRNYFNERKIYKESLSGYVILLSSGLEYTIEKSLNLRFEYLYGYSWLSGFLIKRIDNVIIPVAVKNTMTQTLLLGVVWKFREIY